jgi:GTPase SAR1 family protein
MDREAQGIAAVASTPRLACRVYHTHTTHALVLTVVLVANKIDLDARRVVSEAAGRKLASQHALEYFECSAVCWPACACLPC